MNEVEKINNTDLAVKVYQNQRVVTFKDIDMVHERPEGTAGRNFRENKDKFIENEDFFCLTGDELKSYKQATNFVGSNAREFILITEQGYLMLVKSFTDDLAWSVQRELVKSYFRKPVKKIPKLISMADLEEKDPFIKVCKTGSGGVVLANDEVYSLSPDEIEQLSRFIPELEKQNIGQMQYTILAFLRSMKSSGKLEEIASWGVKQEEPPQRALLPDKEVQKPRKSFPKARGEDLNSVLLLTDKQAQARYSMGRAGVVKAANECGAVVLFGKRLRFDRAKMDEYIIKEYSE